MLNRSVQFLLLLLIAGCCASCWPSESGYRYGANRIRLQTADDLHRFLTYHEKRYPLVSAHRGGPTLGYPENAIETFEYQTRHQPLIIECDVRMTADSVLVLMHDATVDRTTNGSGKVAEYTLEALKKLYLRDVEGNEIPYRVPTLDEALRWGKNKVIFTLDVKRDVPYAAVVAAIRRNSAAAYSIVITYNADQAATVHQLDPELMISASIGSETDLLRLNERNVPDNRLIAFIGTREADEAFYRLLHDHGIMCIMGTMGNLDKQATARGDQVYTEFVERGADVLSTDRPREAGKALDVYRNAYRLTSPFIK